MAARRDLVCFLSQRSQALCPVYDLCSLGKDSLNFTNEVFDMFVTIEGMLRVMGLSNTEDNYCKVNLAACLSRPAAQLV